MKKSKSYYVIIMELLSERNISCSSLLSFSPQISTGGSSIRFQTRTAVIAQPLAVV